MMTNRAPTVARARRPAVREPEETRQALLDSAVALFGRDGFHATSVSRVVERAGVTKGAFYHHFDSKEDLLREMHDAFIDHQLAAARVVLAADLAPDEALRRFIVEVLMEPVARFKDEIAVFFQERRFLSEEAFADIKEKRDEFERCAIELVQRGIDEGAFRDAGAARLIAFGVIGMSAWSYNWLDPDGPVSARDLGELYANVVLDGLRRQETR